jgi:transposase
VLPHASLVVDKFHITRMANESMEVVRKGLKSSLTAPQRRTLKGDRKALLTRKHDLKDWQSLIMETWLNAFPELKTAYDLKEGFYGVWDASCDKDARERYARWKAGWRPEYCTEAESRAMTYEQIRIKSRRFSNQRL